MAEFRIASKGATLNVIGLKNLDASNSQEFGDAVRAALQPEHTAIQIDLSKTSTVDSCGLGVLISLHKTMQERKGTVQVRNPSRKIRDIFELTRLQRIIEIDPKD